MKDYISLLVLSPLLLTACSKPQVCQVWVVLEESHSGTAQRIDVALERALNADDHLGFASGPGPGTATFILKRADLAGGEHERITLTYEAADPGGGNAVRRTLDCGVTGIDCMPVVLNDLQTQCAIRSSRFIPTDAP